MAFALYTGSSGLNSGEPSLSPAANRVWTSWGFAEGEDHMLTPGAHNDNITDDTISVMVRIGRFLIHLGEALTGDPTP